MTGRNTRKRGPCRRFLAGPLKAAAEQQCGVPDCNFMFPDPGDDCNDHDGDCRKQCDSSDGAAATGLGFLTAAAAVAAAL